MPGYDERPASRASARHDEPDSAARAGSNLVALICDDEELILDLLEHHLSSASFEVLRASDGGEALAHLNQRTPDIVILDVMMPVVDGHEVLRQIRENEALRHIPVIMLTMRDSEPDVVGAFQTGASDYLAKPFMSGDLLERVKRLVAPPNHMRMTSRA